MNNIATNYGHSFFTNSQKIISINNTILNGTNMNSFVMNRLTSYWTETIIYGDMKP